jgi:Ca-activated chloride channel family protein
MKNFWIALSFCLLGLAFFVFPAQADGIIVPDFCLNGIPCPVPPQPCIQGKPCPPVPPRPRPNLLLNIKYHHVNVTIDNQVAVTRVDQVFQNPNAFAVEGTYVFPLPVDAAVSRFTLWVDGKPVEGKVLDAGEARKIYEEIVRSQRDPALLEYAGRGMVQARIFPIPPQGERRIELEYSQTLVAENGLVRYLYPLNTEKFSTAPLESVSVTVSITSAQRMRAVYSPSHAVQVIRKDDTHAVASYEANNVRPDTDFSLYYSLGESEAFHVMTFRDPKDPNDPDGFFLILLAPRPEQDSKPMPKDVIVVLDHSGSMEGEKFRQAQEALRYILKNLNQEDRFGLVGFSSAVEEYAGKLRPAEEAVEAIAWVDQLSARGSTDINLALLNSIALADKERPTYLIFLTDGLPTVGETRREKILDNFAKAAPANVRLFPFGVGYDVDTFLLDTLAQEHHGLSTYIRPGEALDEAISAFYERISTPVLANLELNFGGLSVYDIYPPVLPDLFSGGQVVVVGRYRIGGTFDVSLSGQTNNNKMQTFSFAGQHFSEDTRNESAVLSSLPRLWATRKVGYLLNKIRLEGADQESIDQVVRLSIRYGIVTPYTSYLVTEPMPLGLENQQKLAEESFRKAQAAPAPAASGKGAVDKAADQGGMSQAQQAPGMSESDAQKVKVIGSRTFVLNQGIWVDTRYDPKSMKAAQVAFLSPDYFALTRSQPDLASALALGERVIVVFDGNAYEVVSEETVTQPVVIPPTPPSLTTPAVPGPTTEPVSTQKPGIVPAPAVNDNDRNTVLAVVLAVGFTAGIGFWFVRKRYNQ